MRTISHPFVCILLLALFLSESLHAQRAGPWAVVQTPDSSWQLIDTTGKSLLPADRDGLYRVGDYYACSADTLFNPANGQFFSPPPFTLVPGLHPSFGQLLPRYAYRDPEGFGFIDGTGTWRLPVSWTYATVFEQGRAVVALTGRKGDYSYGFYDTDVRTWTQVDTAGREVYPRVQAQEIRQLREGHVAVRRENLWGFLDETGQERIPCLYRSVTDFAGGVAVVRSGTGYGLMDAAGNPRGAQDYTELTAIGEGMYAWSREVQPQDALQIGEPVILEPEGHRGLMDSLGRETTPAVFTSVRGCVQGKIAVSWSETAAGYVNPQGQACFPRRFTWTFPYQEGLAMVRKGRKYGYLDTQGAWAIPPRYTEARLFSHGRAAVQYRGLWGYLNPQGHWAIPPAYLTAWDFE